MLFTNDTEGVIDVGLDFAEEFTGDHDQLSFFELVEGERGSIRGTRAFFGQPGFHLIGPMLTSRIGRGWRLARSPALFGLAF